MEETEWPISRTEYQKLYLSAQDTRMYASVSDQNNRVSYAADANAGKLPPQYTGARFVTEPFAEDTVLAGYPKLKLYVSSTSKDMALIAHVNILDEDGVLVPVVVDLDPATPHYQGRHESISPETG